MYQRKLLVAKKHEPLNSCEICTTLCKPFLNYSEWCISMTTRNNVCCVEWIQLIMSLFFYFINYEFVFLLYYSYNDILGSILHAPVLEWTVCQWARRLVLMIQKWLVFCIMVYGSRNGPEKNGGHVESTQMTCLKCLRLISRRPP